MVKISECTRENFCVDCDDPDCIHAGDIEADCPKWRCDNPTMDCKHCGFLEEYKREVKQMDELIGKHAAINEVERAKVRVHHSVERAIGRGIIEILDDVEKNIRELKPAEPKRETTTLKIGRSRNSVTMWYECAECGEPVDQEDAFCRRCGRGIIHG